MGKKLYVGNLPYEIKEDELSQVFSQVGTVESAQIIADKFSGRSKGFGFVEMSSDKEAKAAVEKLNGTEVGGRPIKVDEARPMTERKPRGEFQGKPDSDQRE